MVVVVVVVVDLIVIVKKSALKYVLPILYMRSCVCVRARVRGKKEGREGV